MDHSASFYLMDAQAESRVLLNNSIGAAAIAHDVQRLLR
jgi:protein SCO1/2